MGRIRWIVLCVGAGLIIGLLATKGWREDEPDAFEDAPPSAVRVFEGLVLDGDRPVEGATVTLWEDVDAGFATAALARSDGSFRLEWRPTATTSPDRLFLAAAHRERRSAVLQARPGGIIVRLAPLVTSEGRVVNLAGEPVANAEVQACLRHGATAEPRMTTDADGRFRIDGLPRGAALDVYTTAVGFHERLERRFVAGDFLTVHVDKGHPVWLRVTDPYGSPVASARARLPVPPALRSVFREANPEGRILLSGVSDGGVRLLAVEAAGYLPVEVPAWANEETPVVLWPARRVNVLAWDAWNGRGVQEVSFEAEIRPTGGDWWGGSPGSILRRYPVRPGDGTGQYHASLPACPLKLRLSAPEYVDADTQLEARTTRVRVRMTPPRQGRKPGLLVVRAAPDTPDLDLIVADDEGAWIQRVALVGGRAELRVPPGKRLQMASAGAADGVWVPKHKVDPLEEGKRRAVKIGTLPAVRATITVNPVAAGEVKLIDVAHERVAPPLRAPLRDGRAEFWVRPLRKLRVEIAAEGEFRPYEGEFETEREDIVWEARLLTGAGLRYHLEDRGENNVPFVSVRVWEPGLGGRMVLRGRPVIAATDASGAAAIHGLREGKAAVEVVAPGFRTQRFALVRLTRDSVFASTVTLAPAGSIEGRVRNEAGAAIAGVSVRALAPRIARLGMPGGGERDVYDLTAWSAGEAATDAEGRFKVRDATPRAPVLALYPRAGSPFAAAALAPAPELTLTETAYVELDVPSSVQGVYLLLPPTRAVLVKTDPPMSLRPLPVVLPAGQHSLYVRLRDGRWAAPLVSLRPGESVRLNPDFRR